MARCLVVRRVRAGLVVPLNELEGVEDLEWGAHFSSGRSSHC